jgi:glutathione S-transferase
LIDSFVNLRHLYALQNVPGKSQSQNQAEIDVQFKKILDTLDNQIKKNEGKFLQGDTPTVADFVAAAMYFNAKTSIPDLYKMITFYDSLANYFKLVE